MTTWKALIKRGHQLHLQPNDRTLYRCRCSRSFRIGIGGTAIAEGTKLPPAEMERWESEPCPAR